jgi:hypothetical protein
MGSQSVLFVPTVVYDPLQALVYGQNESKGLIEKPLWIYTIHLFTLVSLRVLRPTNKLIIGDFVVHLWRKPSIALRVMGVALMKKSVETVMKMDIVTISLVRRARVQVKLGVFLVPGTVQSVMVMVI